jgi:hypothetical protein
MRGPRILDAEVNVSEVLACLFCRATLIGKQTICCARQGCKRAHKAHLENLEFLRARVREQLKCRFCAAASLEGKPYCDTHQYEKTPCSKCLRGKVLRHIGPGRPKTICVKCEARAMDRGGSGRRRSFSDETTGLNP